MFLKNFYPFASGDCKGSMNVKEENDCENQ